MPAYYLIDSRTKTITPATPEMVEERRRIESSSRKLVSAYSSEIQRYLKLGYRMKNPYMGFRKLAGELEKRGVRDAKALAAWIGRKKYGAKRFAQMAAKKLTRRNPESSSERYMIAFFNSRGTMIEAGLSSSVSDLARYASREDAVNRGYWALFDRGELIRSGPFNGALPESVWRRKLSSDPVRWVPKHYWGRSA